MRKHRIVFVGGLHRSGTTLLTRCLQDHPEIAGFTATGVKKDEGQFLQSVYPPAGQYGGPGAFAFASDSHYSETSSLASEESRRRLWREWSQHWDLDKPYLIEKSPPNLLKTRFLQACFPEAHFIIITRHPIAVSLATWKWSDSSLSRLMQHWIVAHRRFGADRHYLKHCHWIRYEDFIDRPEVILSGISDFLGIRSHGVTRRIRSDGNARYFQEWVRRNRGLRRLQHLLITLRHEPHLLRYGYSLRSEGYVKPPHPTTGFA